MLRRLLNIASIVCLVLCVALMGMWVRSFWRADFVTLATPSQICRVASALGQIRCEGLNGVPLAVVPKSRRTWNVTADDRKTHFLRSFLVYADINAGRFDFAVPYWFLVFLSGTIAAILWKKREKRFSLRSLFIVTTFLAVVLGMIAWLDRAWIGR